MKSQSLRLTAAIALFAGACLANLSAATITLNADDLLGWVSPSNPNSEATHTAQVKFFVEKYNLGVADGTNLGDNPNDGGPAEVNWLYRPDGAPANLALPVISGANVNTSNPVVDLNGFTYEYILFKQNTDSWIYYIGDIAGTNSINWGGNPLTHPDAPNENGSAISHYVLFNGRPDVEIDPRNTVPDGGATIVMLGSGLLLMALTVRRKKTA